MARKLQDLDDVHEAMSSFNELVRSVRGAGRGAKIIAGLLAAAITANPVIGQILSPQDEVVSQLAEVSAKLDEGKTERRALAAWLWAIEQCRQGQAACPNKPPAPVRLMLAQDEIENGHGR